MTDKPVSNNPLPNKERIKLPRQRVPEQEAQIRACNFHEVNLGFPPEMARQESLRCIECPKPGCIEKCPVSVNVRAVIDLILAGDYLGAASKVRDAYLAYARNTLPAPVTGYVAKRSVQVGQRVSPGTPLMAIVPLDGVWVDANYKESQLRNMRIGQPVTLTADVYGGKVEYHGRVVGFSAGTGSAFSLLPAQNATGNWIKVVQRLPVRVEIPAEELEKHPLRVGLSMNVDVNVKDANGAQLGTDSTSSYKTNVFANYGDEANAAIARIIAANE